MNNITKMNINYHRFIIKRKIDKFYEAEEYHQDFVKRNPNQGYVKGESIPRRERTLAKVKDLVKSDLK